MTETCENCGFPTDINLPLLTKVMVRVYRSPDTWDQDSWGVHTEGLGVADDPGPGPTECGTTYCIAGHTAVVQGAKQYWNYGALVGVADPDTQNDMPVGSYAARELGLCDCQADRLFHSSNMNAWSRVAEVTGGAITKAKISELASRSTSPITVKVTDTVPVAVAAKQKELV
jgi:hypothetical protein